MLFKIQSWLEILGTARWLVKRPRHDTFMGRWHIHDKLKEGNRSETCTCVFGKTCTTGASTTSSVTSSRVPFASFLRVASTQSCSQIGTTGAFATTPAILPDAEQGLLQATRRHAAREPIQHTRQMGIHDPPPCLFGELPHQARRSHKTPLNWLLLGREHRRRSAFSWPNSLPSAR